MANELLRNDIVGHVIRGFWVTEWGKNPPIIDFGDGFYTQELFVELETGVFFEVFVVVEEEETICSIDPEGKNLKRDDSPLSEQCCGCKIVEVMQHPSIPTFILLLDNDKYIYCSAECPFYFKSEFCNFNDSRYDKDEFVTYWGHKNIS